jgi:hypothetical protein
MCLDESLARTIPALLFAFALNGCERKAPGPAECIEFADVALGAVVRRGEPLQIVEFKRDELIRQCLTTPFDRRMLACVERTREYRACRVAFDIRRSAP